MVMEQKKKKERIKVATIKHVISGANSQSKMHVYKHINICSIEGA